MSAATVDINLNSSQILSPSGDNNIHHRRLRKEWIKLAKQKARLLFLLKCRRKDISPRFVTDRVSHLLYSYERPDTPICVKVQAKSLSRHLQRSILNMEISICNKSIEYISNLTRSIEQILESNVSSEELSSIQNSNKEIFNLELKQSNQNLHVKMTKLMDQQNSLGNIKYDEGFIKNFTDTVIPNDVMTILSLGPKFAITPKETPILELATDVEAIIAQQLPKDERREARGEALDMLTKFSKQNKHLSHIDRYLRKAAGTAKQFLRNNRNLMVSTSDKGGVTIISKKDEYFSTIRALLSDLNSFTPLDDDPTVKIKGRINRFLDKLYHGSYISDELKKSLKTWNIIPPRLFGQIKYHKTGNPIRLIVSTINSAAYKMSRFLATILRKAFKPKYGVKNS